MPTSAIAHCCYTPSYLYNLALMTPGAMWDPAQTRRRDQVHCRTDATRLQACLNIAILSGKIRKR